MSSYIRIEVFFTCLPLLPLQKLSPLSLTVFYFAVGSFSSRNFSGSSQKPYPRCLHPSFNNSRPFLRGPGKAWITCASVYSSRVCDMWLPLVIWTTHSSICWCLGVTNTSHRREATQRGQHPADVIQCSPSSLDHCWRGHVHQHGCHLSHTAIHEACC